jgi:hypothetical protein
MQICRKDSEMRLINPDRLLPRRSTAACLCAISLIVLGGCSSSRGIYSGKTPQSATTSEDMVTADPQVREALAGACFDCHSNQKPHLWNTRLAPSYLFGVDNARLALNFSDWPTYSSQRRRAELYAIGKVVADGSMPPGDYDFLHPGAKLSAEQKQILLQWVERQTAVAH